MRLKLRTEFPRQIPPGSASAKNPDGTVEDVAGVLGRPATALLTRRTEDGLDPLPGAGSDVVSAHL